jgi:Zn-dependent protease with chaperone function
MLSQNELAGRRRMARSITLVVAVFVHLPALLLLSAAVLLLRTDGFSIPAVLVPIGLLLVAFQLRPRFGQLPKGAPRLTKRDAPMLFGLLDQISRALRAHPPEWVTFDLMYNCSTALVGLRRKRVINIGLPLWSVLDDVERLALFAHENAHDTNGDLSHTLVIQSALSILRSTARVLTPPSRFTEAGGITGFAEMLAEVLMALLSSVFYFFLRVLRRYARRASPTAEYLADQEAARIAGRDATVSLLDKLYLAGPTMGSLSLTVRRGNPKPWATVRKEVAELPPKERERQRRLGRRAGHHADETHPPTALRIDVVNRLQSTTPLIQVSQVRAAQINSEVERVQAEFSEALSIGE